MKQLDYPRRLTILVDEKHGKMLDFLCKTQHHERPGAFLKALELYHAQIVAFVKREAEPLRKAG